MNANENEIIDILDSAILDLCLVEEPMDALIRKLMIIKADIKNGRFTFPHPGLDSTES